MDTPQFLVMLYFLLWFALKCITFGLDGLGYTQRSKLVFTSARTYTENWLVSVTTQAILVLALLRGGFWG